MKKPPPQEARNTDKNSASAAISTGRRRTRFRRSPNAPEENSAPLPTTEFSVPAEPISTPDEKTQGHAPYGRRGRVPSWPTLQNSLPRSHCTPRRSDHIDRYGLPVGMIVAQISSSMEC